MDVGRVVGGVLALLVSWACGWTETVAEGVGLPAADEVHTRSAPPAAETEHAPASPAEHDAAAGPGLGATVAELVPAPPPPPGPLGSDLDLVAGIHVENVTASWTRSPKNATHARMGAVFEVIADVTVDADVGINQARVVAKAACAYKHERRASAADLTSPHPRTWGGRAPVDAEEGEHAQAWAHLFPRQDIVGHTPCQVEFRLISQLSDKPLRVPGTWCARDDTTEAGPCPELTPAAPGSAGFELRDIEFERTQRVVHATVEFGERVWLDRDLFLRSSCDNGGERLPRTTPTSGDFGLVDPGDSIRVEFRRYDGFFGAEPPCELTLEWWRRTDAGHRAAPEVAATMCVHKFLPSAGPCPQERDDRPGAMTPLTLRTLDLAITRDRYNRAYHQLTADLDVLANEHIEGRYDLELKGECGRGRARQARVLGPTHELNAAPAMLRAGEATIGRYVSWVPPGTRSCEVEVSLVPRLRSGASSTALGKFCVDRHGSRPC